MFNGNAESRQLEQNKLLGKNKSNCRDPEVRSHEDYFYPEMKQCNHLADLTKFCIWIDSEVYE